MLRHFLPVTILGLFLFGAVGVQSGNAQGAYTTRTITAASLADLPCSTETYMAIGNKFTWTFEWDNVWTSGTVAIVYPRVVSSTMSGGIDNNSYSTGHHQLTGTDWTNYPSDYLRLTKDCGWPCDVITNMVFTVKYIQGTPQAPQGP